MERCPSCNANINANSNFCNECGYNLKVSQQAEAPVNIPKKSYKLRSPILESDILFDKATAKEHGMMIGIPYAFWLFAVIFVVYGVKIILDSYTTALFKGVMDASLVFALALFCFMLPGLLHLFVDIEEHLAIIAKEAKKDKLE